LARIFGNSVPGDGFESLGNLILLLGVGFILLPPIAFALVGVRVGVQRLPLAFVLMGVLQVVFLAGVVMALTGTAVRDSPWIWILLVIFGVPTLAGGIALVLTGNLTSPATDTTRLK
jgi:hypothetical protein